MDIAFLVSYSTNTQICKHIENNFLSIYDTPIPDHLYYLCPKTLVPSSILMKKMAPFPDEASTKFKTTNVKLIQSKSYIKISTF